MKNLKSVILNSVMIALGILYIGFMAGTYLPLEEDFAYTGYTLMSTCFQIGFGDGYMYPLFAIPTLIALILVVVLTVFAVLNLLISLNVIKSEKLAKIVNKYSKLVALLALVMVVLSLIGFFGIIREVGYAFIINIILVIATLALAMYMNRSAKKEE